MTILLIIVQGIVQLKSEGQATMYVQGAPSHMEARLNLSSGSCSAEMPSSCRSFLTAACLTPGGLPETMSAGESTSLCSSPCSGWLQQVFVQTSGNVTCTFCYSHRHCANQEVASLSARSSTAAGHSV